MARWRGFDSPFGDILTNLDGIIIDVDADSHPNHMTYVYTCQDSSKYADTLNDSYVKVGEAIPQRGYIRSFDLGDAAHIIPHVIGGNATQYICDYNNGNAKKDLFTLLIGGDAEVGALSGLAYFRTNQCSYASSEVGFRTVSKFVPSDK